MQIVCDYATFKSLSTLTGATVFYRSIAGTTKHFLGIVLLPSSPVAFIHEAAVQPETWAADFALLAPKAIIEFRS